MRIALEEAALALGWSSPNPAVGAVVVRDGEVVGRGHTQPPGGDHAEVVALREAGERARGADVYCTLEPCCALRAHAAVRAGAARARASRPCTTRSKIRIQQVRGEGHRQLREAGVAVASRRRRRRGRRDCSRATSSTDARACRS